MEGVALKKQGYELLHDGAIALAQIEKNGIRVDISRLAKTQTDLKKKVRDLKANLEQHQIWKLWRKRFGEKSNMTSGNQLGKILFEELGYKATNFTDSGKAATDEEAMQNIDEPFVKDLLRMKKFEKARGTFLKGISEEIVGERLHPFFNLHLARTYRSSSDSPNFQNFPVRDKEISELIRSHFIPSPNSVLVENDFKGIEVCVSACYHKDKNFISYIETPGKDMHGDMAAQIYFLDPKKVHKDARYGAKNKFVFPEFYGDFYVSCAKALWEWIEKGKLVGPHGRSLYEHLKENGISKLGDCDPEQKPRPGTFENHLKEVENDFWNNRFKDYGKWKKRWYAEYLDKGYFDLLSGFRVFGSFNRNSVINYPVQGAAFHCLLWVLIQVNQKLIKYKMKSMVVGQIHDSLLGDVLIHELRDYLSIVEETVTVDLPKFYRWLIVKMVIEYEICPENGNWFQKREVKFREGKFLHPENPDKFTTDPFKFIRTLDPKEV